MTSKLCDLAPALIKICLCCQVDRDGTVLAGDGEASSSDSDSDMDEDAMEATPSDAVQPAKQQGPVIDEEGFELVQKRRPRGRDKG